MGLNFAIIPRQIPHNAIIAATETTCKQLKSEDASELRKVISNALHGAKPPKQNVEKRLRCAITGLRNDESITILPADKGNVMAILDREEYRSKMMEILDDPTYKKLKSDPMAKIEKHIAESLKTH